MKIAIEIEITFGGEATGKSIVAEFDLLRPVPPDVYEAFLLAHAESKAGPEEARTVASVRAGAALFDGSVRGIMVRDGTEVRTVTADELDSRLKVAAVTALLERWDARGKAHARSSAATSASSSATSTESAPESGTA